MTNHQTALFFFFNKNKLYRNIEAEISELLICSECTPMHILFSKPRIVIIIIFQRQIGRKITIFQLGPVYCYGKKEYISIFSGQTYTQVTLTISIIRREIGGKLWGSQMTLLLPHWPLGQFSRDMIGEKLFAKLI